MPEDKVVELHGNTTYANCLDCGQRYELAPIKKDFVASGKLPICEKCDGIVKTATISFGQAMPEIQMARAQDETHIDVAYATIPLAAGASYVQLTYPLRTLATAYTVEILACEAGGPPVRVIPPQFPPGVFPPEQPWTPNSA